MMMSQFEKEIQIVRENQIRMQKELIKVKADNKLLMDRVVYLEENAEEKEDKIKELYKMIENVAEQVGDVIRTEINEALEHQNGPNSEMEKKLNEIHEELRVHLDSRCDQLLDVIRLSHNVNQSMKDQSKSVLLSNSKEAESSMRTKQKNIMILMQKLQEKLALRVRPYFDDFRI
jgi:seryl-tRNA synthetase